MTDPSPITTTILETPEEPPTMLRLVAIILGLTLVLSVVAITTLAVLERPMPDVLQNLAVGALSALSALLVGRR